MNNWVRGLKNENSEVDFNCTPKKIVFVKCIIHIEFLCEIEMNFLEPDLLDAQTKFPFFNLTHSTAKWNF